MTSTSVSTSASTSATATATISEATAVARDLIASFGQDPERYVPGTVTTLPGTRTATYDMACSPRCPHQDRRCHRPHAAWLSDAQVHAQIAVPRAATRHTHVRVPAQARTGR